MKFSFVGLAALAIGAQTALAATCECQPEDTSCIQECGKYLISLQSERCSF